MVKGFSRNEDLLAYFVPGVTNFVPKYRGIQLEKMLSFFILLFFSKEKLNIGGVSSS